jgi:SAM-dependent methyltransferase
MKKIYSENYYFSWGASQGTESYWYLKKALAARFLSKLTPTEVPARVLDVGCATGAGLSVISEMGWLPYGVEVNRYAVKMARAHVPEALVYEGTLETMPSENGFFHAIIFSDVLEHLREPEKELRRAFDLLLPDGSLLILTPDIESVSARLMHDRWIHIKREHLFYFSSRSLQMMLERVGFQSIEIEPAPKPMNLEYAVNQFASYRVPAFSSLFTFFGKLVPKKLQRIVFTVPMGEMLAVARKTCPKTGNR